MLVFHILTVGVHKRLGCPLMFMSKIRAEQTRHPWGTCVAHANWWVCLWPTIQVHGRAGTPALRPSWSELPFLAIRLCFPGSMQRSAFSNLLPSLASMSTHIRISSPGMLLTFPVGLVVGMPLGNSSWTCPSACSACIPQVPNGAGSHPIFTAALLLWLTREPPDETQAGLSVCRYAVSGMTMCFSSSSPSPWRNSVLRASHF